MGEVELPGFTEEPWFKDLVKDIKDKKVIFWVGAGISKNSPSNLPLAGELKFHILNGLCYDQQLNETLFDEEVGSKIEDYPLEAFFQTVVENVFDLPETFQKIFMRGEPNLNHRFIAKSMAKGWIIKVLTTNFDLLLENALRDVQRGVKFKFQRFWAESEFEKLEPETFKRPTLLKIHGSIEDPESIRATLAQVGSRMLSSSRLKALNSFMNGEENMVLVLGYGGKDHFDINPFFSSFNKKNLEFIWIQHEKGEMMSPGNRLPTPFDRFKGTMFKIDTDKFVGSLWSTILEEKPPEVHTDYISTHEYWRQDIKRWQDGIVLEAKYFLIGRILQEINQYERSLHFFQRAFKESPELKHEEEVARILQAIATIQYCLGRFEEAEMRYKQVLEIRRRIGNQKEMVVPTLNLGVLYQQIGESKKAEELFKDGLRWAESAGHWKGVGNALQNLGVLAQEKGNLEKAEKFYKRSLKIRRKIGDEKGLGQVLNQLAILHLKKGKLHEAEELLNQCLDIVQKMVDQRAHAAILHQLGILSEKQGKLNLAENLYRQSLDISERIGYRYGVALTKIQLGKNLEKKHRFEAAFSAYSEALSIFEELNDKKSTENVKRRKDRIKRILESADSYQNDNTAF